MKLSFSDTRFFLFGAVSIIICAAVFGFVSSFSPAPFTLRTKKLLMPGSIDTYLMSEEYSIWYFPVWKDLKIDYPHTAVRFKCSGDVAVFLRGDSSPMHEDQKRSGTVIGRLIVNSEGMHSISASTKTSYPFVIALVPIRNHYYDATGRFSFDGIYDNNIEPTGASNVEEMEMRKKKLHQAADPPGAEKLF